jgi:peptidoglycan hydrolase-like protein with peptidoglycan-binding domain
MLLATGVLGVPELLATAAHKPSRHKSASSNTGTKPRRSKSSKKSSGRERGQKAPAPDRITAIQTALAKDGSYVGDPNGKWDASTVEAMKRFQVRHGLNPSGKLDAKSLQQLGLGSQTAGVAAPPEPADTSVLTFTPSQTARRQQ